jgi:cation diffusion facilitator CzcD-associated flavoprotein CzcO
MQNNALELDVLIIGAGLSGVDAAWHLQRQLPHLRYAILESRAELGGTWSLFRYPGIRSDSDMYTLGFPFRPWQGERSLADGATILQYMKDTAKDTGIDQHIRLHHRAVAASWDSAVARWKVTIEVGSEREVQELSCRFLHLCTGYYDYEQGHAPSRVRKRSAASVSIRSFGPKASTTPGSG